MRARAAHEFGKSRAPARQLGSPLPPRRGSAEGRGWRADVVGGLQWGSRVERRLSMLALLLALAPLTARAQTVDNVVASHSGGCTTAGVEGLSDQLVRSQICANPGAFLELTPYPNISVTSSRVHALGTSATVTALHHAADHHALSVNSAFRTLVEQYLLYKEGGCGLAAVPGNSNHESGRAVDLQNYSAALSAMTAAGCTHPYPSSDPVHFDCPGTDMRAASVLTFQRLWNANHPEDRIAEDGAYGPQTGARLGRSPAGGFAMDLCAPPPPVEQWGAGFLMQTFPLASADPIVMHPGEEMVGTIELSNSGNQTWNSSTRLGTTQPRDRASVFAGADWDAPNRADSVDGTVAPGDSYPFTFTIRAPDAPGDYREYFGVVQEGVTWFSDAGQLGPPDDQLQIHIVVVEAPPPPPPADAGTVVAPQDAGVGGEDASVWLSPDTDAGGAHTPLDTTLVGTCAATPGRRGGAGWIVVALVALAIVRRRARR